MTVDVAVRSILLPLRCASSRLIDALAGPKTSTPKMPSLLESTVSEISWVPEDRVEWLTEIDLAS